MNANNQKFAARNVNLDSIGSVTVLAAAIVIIASSAFESFTEPGNTSVQMARESVVAQRVLVASADAKPATGSVRQ